MMRNGLPPAVQVGTEIVGEDAGVQTTEPGHQLRRLLRYPQIEAALDLSQQEVLL